MKTVGSRYFGVAIMVLALLCIAPIAFWVLRNTPMWMLLVAASAAGIKSARGQFR